MDEREVRQMFPDAAYLLLKQIDDGKERGLDQCRLFELHAQLFTVVMDAAEDEHDVFNGFVFMMHWLQESGNIERFVDRFVDEYSMHLCHLLGNFMSVGMLNKSREAQLSVVTQIERCARDAQQLSSSEKGWRILKRKSIFSGVAQWLKYGERFAEAAEFYELLSAVEPEYSKFYDSDAAECYRKANMPLKAAGILERLGKFEDAARLAEDSGNTELAIRLYQKAELPEEAARILEHLAGMPPTTESTGVTGLEQLEPARANSGRRCSACGALVPEGDAFCGECGCGMGLACPNCGSDVPQGKKFCGKCGAKIG